MTMFHTTASELQVGQVMSVGGKILTIQKMPYTGAIVVTNERYVFRYLPTDGVMLDVETLPEPPIAEPCARCEWDKTVPHDSCLYGGNASGHSKAHCTADACY